MNQIQFAQRHLSHGWFLLSLLLGHSAAQGALSNLPPPKFQPVQDNPYLQEIGKQVKYTVPLTCVAAHGGMVFAGTLSGLVELKGDALQEVPVLQVPVRRLAYISGAFWAATDAGLFRRAPVAGASWDSISSQRFVDLTEHRGELLAATDRRIWRYRESQFEAVSTNECPFVILGIVSHSESIYVLGTGRLTVFGGAGFGGKDVYDFPADTAWDWGTLPSPRTRDLASTGERLVVATERGLGVLRGMSLTVVRGAQGLPVEDINCVVPGFTNDLWIGTARGAIRQVGKDFQYFAGERWLPSDIVSDIAIDQQDVWVATDRGLGLIRYVPFTLERKAAFYESHLQEWGQKRLGFVHKLEWDDALNEFVREVSDNDGGYSGDYLAAQSYRYAVTRDPEARREAANTFAALRWLERMTGIPGYPARSVWAKDERGHKAMHGSGGYPAEWHDCSDTRFEWKGDTSSDELCSHFYAVGLFLELAAQGKEVEQAKSHLGRMAAHLVDHRWQLIDVDGKPTRWGRWDPEYFLSDEGRFDRGLQCLELLSFIKTAEAFTGEPRFTEAYSKLVAMGYPEYTLRQRQTFPPDSVLHFEDQLALWSYWTLLSNEKDPDLRSIYRRSLERTWEVIRVEQQPWFNFVYGALTGNDCEADVAVNHLREWPLDLVVWSYQNSHRADLHPREGYVSLKGGIRSFSRRETEPIRWDAWTMKPDGGSGGRDVVEPSGWLVAYWMGRYHGFITAPTFSGPEVFGGASSIEKKRGAKAYVGPERPELE